MGWINPKNIAKTESFTGELEKLRINQKLLRI